MSAVVNFLESESTCVVCATQSEDLHDIETLDAELPAGQTSLQTKLSALANFKNISGRICDECVQRANESWTFQQQLQASQAEPSLSDKIRVLRQRLRDLTEKIDVYIVIGPEKTDGQPVYTEDNIIMVDKQMLGDADDDVNTIRNEHGQQVYQCSVCTDSYEQLSDYMEHARTHPGDSVHTCWVCGKQFPTIMALKQHRAVHVDIDGLVCKLCHMIFQGQADMKSHRCEARCPSCGDMFDDRSALSQHAAETHGPAGTPPYVCAICMETFEQADKLDAHASKHRTGRQYVCGYDGCLQRFTSRVNMSTHVRKQHASGRPVACDATRPPAQAPSSHGSSAQENGLECSVCGHVAMTTAGQRKHMRSHIVQMPQKEYPVKRGRPKKVKMEAVEFQPDMLTQSDLVEAVDCQVYGEMDQDTVLIQQEELPAGEYQLTCVDGQEMTVEMLEEEVEYLEVETLDEDLEDEKLMAL